MSDDDHPAADWHGKDKGPIVPPMQTLPPGYRCGAIGKLEFPLPEEARAFQMAAGSVELFSALHEVDNDMRALLKSDTEWTGIQVAERVRELLSETLHKFAA